jgi:hypothetical protein
MKTIKKFAAVAVAFSVLFTLSPAQADTIIASPVAMVSGAGGVIG